MEPQRAKRIPGASAGYRSLNRSDDGGVKGTRRACARFMNTHITAKDLVDALWPEVFQTEESASAHPAREAKRLAGTPAGAAMGAVSVHARASKERLRELAVARGYGGATAFTMLGQMFSSARSFGSDLIMTYEKSYRATILGIHHGVGVFALLEDAALANGDQELADVAAHILVERRRLVLVAEERLAYFAENPEVAQSRAITKTKASPTKPAHA